MLHKNCVFLYGTIKLVSLMHQPQKSAFFPPSAHNVISHSHWSDASSPNASLPLPLPPLCSSSLLGSWSARSCRAVPVHSFRTKCVCDSVSTFAILARVNFDSVSLPSSLSPTFLIVSCGKTAQRDQCVCVCVLFSGSVLSPPRCPCAFPSLFAFSSYFQRNNPTTCWCTEIALRF